MNDSTPLCSSIAPASSHTSQWRAVGGVLVRAHRSLFAVLFVACAHSSAVGYRRAPGVVVTDHIEYYDVHGTTLRDLREQIDLHGPVSRDTARMAITQAEVHWSFQYDRQPTLCRLSNIAATVDATIVLPKWVDSSDVDPAAVYWWRNTTDELRSHEGAHLQIAIDAASEIRNNFLRMTSSDCGQLGRDANARASAIVVQSYERQRDLDRRTRNGTLRQPS